MNSLDINQILEILPHRYPFVMIDRVLDHDTSTLTAIKNFTFNEHYAQGHFPNNPIMPGVMQVECMAQASTVLAFKYIEQLPTADLVRHFSKGAGILFVGSDQVRFKKVVKPGDQMKIHTTMTRHARNLFEFDCYITVDNIVVSEGKLKAAAGL
jgi:3-hydroxyacyl-[acyl-carrier-protein] dehydratase